MNTITFLEGIYRDNRKRVVRRRNIALDLVRAIKNALLRPVELLLLKKYQCGAYPPVFLVGVPRSGTTLLSQVIINHFDIGYISNTVSTYWRSPLVGIMLNSPRGASGSKYESFLGLTDGPEAPHEFGYFWQWWMGHVDHDDVNAKHLDSIEWGRIRDEITGISCFLERHLLIKNPVYIDYKIARVAEEFPNSKFIFVTREPLYCVQSILESRVKRYGDPSIWWSIRPASVAGLMNREPLEQVVAQYLDVHRAIVTAGDLLGQVRFLTVHYEDIGNLDAVLERIGDFLGMTPRQIDRNLNLVPRNELRLPDEQVTRVRTLLDSNRT